MKWFRRRATPPIQPEHGCSELADFFGGYLCFCGVSYTRSHEQETRVTPPEESQG